MKIIGEKLSNHEMLSVKGGDPNTAEYCLSLLVILSNPENGQHAIDLANAAYAQHCEAIYGPSPY